MFTKIGFVDSGIGGLSVLNETIKLLPNAEYLYYVDSINNPYGEKSENEVFEILCGIVGYLKENGCLLIVLACNTATTLCINRLREKYTDIEFVGSEPAVKKAIDNNYQNILVLGTTLTINSIRLNDIIVQNKKDNQKIYLHASKTLARNIEQKNVDLIKKELVLLRNKYHNTNIDCIVLGCTHYCFIKQYLQLYFPDVQIIDGNDGIARRIYNKFKEKFFGTNETKIEFILTDKEKSEEDLQAILHKGLEM